MEKLSEHLDYYLKCMFEISEKVEYISCNEASNKFREKYPDVNLSEIWIDLQSRILIEFGQFMCDDKIRLTNCGMNYCLERFSWKQGAKEVMLFIVKYIIPSIIAIAAIIAKIALAAA